MSSLLIDMQAALAPCAPGGSWYLVNTSEPPAANADGTVKPFIVWQRIVSTSNVSLAGPSNLQNYRVQIDIFATLMSDAESVRQAVVAALAVLGFPVIPLTSQDLYESVPKYRRIILEYSVWYDSTLIERLTTSQTTGRFLNARGNHVQLRGWNDFRYGATQAADGNEDVAAGATLVRLGDRWNGGVAGYTMPGADSMDLTSPQTGYTLQANLDYYDAQVLKYQLAGAWIGFEFDSNYVQANALTDTAMAAKFAIHRQYLINRYRNTDRIAYWGTLVEPLASGFNSGDINALKAWQKLRIQEAQAIDPDTPVAIGTFSFLPASVADVYDPSYENVWYLENYLDDAFTGTDAAWTAKRNGTYNLRKTHKVGVLGDQCGVRTSNDLDYEILNTRLGDLNDYDIDWAYWEKHGATGVNAPGDYASDYVDGTGTRIRKQGTYDAVTSNFTA